MIMQIRPAPLLSALTLVALALGGCGSSDLEDLHDERLDDAIAEAEREPGTDGSAGSTDAGTTGGDVGESVDSGGDAEGGTAGSSDGASDGSNGGDSIGPELGAALPDTLDSSAYTLVFNDEFRATSLDSAHWNSSLLWGPDVVINEELQYYVDSMSNPDFGYSPFTLDGETLTISAIETPESLRASANEQPWLSGVLSSAGKFDFTYGYMEARVDLPGGRGVWPALWMLGSDFVDLKPQLFVMERDGARPGSIFHNYEYVDEAGDLRSPGQFEVEEEDLSTGFHTVGVSWSPEEFLFFLDGEPRYRIIGDNVSQQNMYLILNLAIGGTWPGSPDESTARPSEWAIDYVRVWQRSDPAQ